MTHKTSPQIPTVDVVLIGAGIMSATLGVFLKELNPALKIHIFERLDKVAGESSDAWNNAGTGHSGLCELNYAPEQADGTVDVSKGEKIAEMFEVSNQFWAFLAEKGCLNQDENFIHSCPQMSMVWGDENVAYLKKRYEAMDRNVLFHGITYSDDPAQLQEWVPLIMEGRNPAQKIAATRVEFGTDVNFGILTRSLFKHLQNQDDVAISYNTEVAHLHQEPNGRWIVQAKNLENHEHTEMEAGFVFIGAGGGSLPLLEKSKIAEGDGFAGFPISGQWLKCLNRDIIEKHHAKVYGKAAVGSPPMSVPHLDTRIINGKKELLFGPFAGFSTKFLKEGSYLDLPLSLNLHNIGPLLSAGIHNLGLTEYLIKQLMLSADERLEALKEFFPEARKEDWELIVAGQRVQVIKKDSKQGGILEFGTEVVTHADGSIAALLGASPGASTSVSIMLELLKDCFPIEMASESWQNKLTEMIPTYGKNLASDSDLCRKTRERTHGILGLAI